MSKKILVLLLALAMVLTVVACDKDPKPGPDSNQPNVDSTDAPDTTDNTGGDVQTSDNDASIKVQVEEGWVPHYEAAVERVK